jgi:hypothetical protein
MKMKNRILKKIGYVGLFESVLFEAYRVVLNCLIIKFYA